MSAIFPKECVLADTNTIVDCVGWDPEQGYRMRDDDGKVFYVKANGFILLSEKDEPLWEQDDLGNVREQAMREIVERQPEPSSRQSLQRDSKRGSEAKERVKAIFKDAKGRESVAEIGASYLGTTAAELLKQYEHLDNGRFSMTVRNRVRSKL